MNGQSSQHLCTRKCKLWWSKSEKTSSNYNYCPGRIRTSISSLTHGVFKYSLEQSWAWGDLSLWSTGTISIETQWVIWFLQNYKRSLGCICLRLLICNKFKTGCGWSLSQESAANEFFKNIGALPPIVAQEGFEPAIGSVSSPIFHKVAYPLVHWAFDAAIRNGDQNPYMLTYII